MVKFYNYHKRRGYTLYHHSQLLHWSVTREYTGAFGDKRFSYLNMVNGTLKPCEWGDQGLLIINRDLISINVNNLNVTYGKKFKGIKYTGLV